MKKKEILARLNVSSFGGLIIFLLAVFWFLACPVTNEMSFTGFWQVAGGW